MEINRLYIYGGIAVVIAVLTGVALLWDDATGTGTVHVIGPTTGAVTLFVDGEQRTALGMREHHRLELEQGTHEIRLVHVSGAERTHSILIEDGGYNRVVPGPSQCFADLDVTDAHYRTTYGTQAQPTTVEARHFDGEPFGVGGRRYFSAHMLPNDISRGARAHLVLEVPCNLASASDAALVAAAGYGPPTPAPAARRR